MTMHSVIQQRRKLLGFTQEQIAEYLGVSTPAVNKWEKGTTCPDISLLPPLARLLKIDLNTLFDFYEDITQQELVQFCRDLQLAVSSRGIEAAFSMAQEKIREYPNSDQLLHNTALQLQSAVFTAGLAPDETENYLKAIDDWYLQLSNSHEDVIRNSAYFMLASRAITAEDYQKAQAYLDQIPNRNDTPNKRMLQSTIYMKQNKPDEAAKLLETALLSSVSDMQMILLSLINANIAAGSYDTAAYISEHAVKFSELFDLHQYNAAVVSFQLALGMKNAEKTIDALEKMLKDISGPRNIRCTPLYGRVSINETSLSMNHMIHPLLTEIKQSPEYSYLHANERFQALLAEYDIPST